MKEITKIVTILLGMGIVTLLSSCMTAPKVNYDVSMGTPENSVLVYGMANGISHITFTEVTKSGTPDVLDYTVNGNLVFCPKPLKMGARYKVTYLEGVGSFSYSDMHMGNMTVHSTDRTLDTYDENSEQVKDFDFIVLEKSILVQSLNTLNLFMPQFLQQQPFPYKQMAASLPRSQC